MSAPSHGPILGVIPARYASQRFPGKPLALLGGRPMIEHTWKAARRCRRLDAVVIATDHEGIAATARSFGAEVAMTDPAHPSGSDRAAEAMQQWEAAHSTRVAAVVNIQGDEPMMDPGVVDDAIAALLAPPTEGRPHAMVASAMIPIVEAETAARPDVVKVVVDATTRRALYFSRSPIPSLSRSSAIDLAREWSNLLDTPVPAVYGFKHLGLYAYRREALLRFIGLTPSPLELIEKLEQLRLLENGMDLVMVVARRDVMGIDTPEDLERVQALLAAAQQQQQ